MWSWGVKDSDRAIGAAITLTDAEKIALAHVHAAGNNGLTYFELIKVPNHSADWLGGLGEAAQSIGRLGLVTDRYPNGKVRNAGRVVWLSDTGIERFATLTVVANRFHPCCEFMITLPCVCLYRSYCPTPSTREAVMVAMIDDNG